MIFENDQVLTLVKEWQSSKSPATLDSIIRQSQRLIEAIVSLYDYQYREDLIQEAGLRLVYALPYFDTKLSRLHTFFTTVIHNACRTYIKKQYTYDNVVEPVELPMASEDVVIHIEDDTLADCICRNRVRFPSLAQEIIDGATTFIIIALKDSHISKRAVIEALTNYYQLEKYKASTIYTSTVIYLRNRYCMKIARNPAPYNEFSLGMDFKEVMGDKLYHKLSLILSGISVRMP